MGGAVPPIPQYALMAWCSGGAQGQDWKRPLGRPRRRWEDNIILDRRKIRWLGVDWMHVVKDRDQWRVL
jgi:hypothetical protein